MYFSDTGCDALLTVIFVCVCVFLGVTVLQLEADRTGSAVTAISFPSSWERYVRVHIRAQICLIVSDLFQLRVATKCPF